MKRMTLCPTVLALGLAVVLASSVAAQQASQNIPVLPVIPDLEPGDEGYDPLWYLKGDGYLQRQVEPTIAVSTRNPDHLLSFFVDYRAVNVWNDVGLGEETQTWTAAIAATSLLFEGLISLPQIPYLETLPIAAAEAWVGGSRSYDGGLTWSGFFMPGAPLEFYYESGVAPSDETKQMPIYGLQAATDPVAVAGPCGYVYVVFMAFTRGDESKMVVARFQDLNNLEGGDTWEFQGMTVVESGNNATNGYFLDKPAIALDIFRDPSDFSTWGPIFSAEECGHSVYISYSTFNGLEADGKFRSKINFAKSNDAGNTWVKSKIQQPYNQNQGSALAVDPNNGHVYLVWRHFFDPDTVLMVKTEDRGKKFSKAVDLTEGSQMYPYDQPTISTTSVHPDPDFDSDPFFDLTFRSNAFPTAAAVANGDNDSTLFVAWQEYVGSDGFPDPLGSPRIVLTRSANGGTTWGGPGISTDPADGYWPTRRAVDFADRDIPCQPEDPGYDPETLCLPEPGFGALPDDRPSGPQVMPWLSAGGGKLALAYHESRGLLGGVSVLDPGEYDFHDVGIQYVDLTGWDYISGLDRVVDFRVALLDPVTGYADGTAQVSRYPISRDADFTINGEDVDDVARIVPLLCGADGAPPEYCQPRLDFKNKPQSASGTAPFQGDYPGMSPISPFVFAGDKWSWATSEADVTYPGFHVVFADNRNLVPATIGAQYEEDRYSTYDPANCENVGSRNTDVMTAQVNADIMVSAPTTYKSLENPVNSFPFMIRNTTDHERTFFLELAGDTDNASFSYDIYAEDPGFPGVFDIADEGEVTVYPFSSVSQVVYISSSAAGPVYVNVYEDDSLAASLTFNAGFSNLDVYSGEEYENPFVRNPFVRNPFVRNSSSTNVSLSNPFVRNPFVRNPFVRNTSVADVIDTTWEVKPDEGTTTAATYFPIININNAAEFVDNYAFQLIVWKQSGFGGASDCDASGIAQDQILSNVVQDPEDTTQNPFVLNPSAENPFVRNPFVRNPFVANPFVRNSAFTMAPADLESNTVPIETTTKLLSDSPDDVTLAAPPAPNGVNVTLRAHRLKKYCDESGANLNDCLQKPLCRGSEDPAEDLCVHGIVECEPGEEPGTNGCVVPNVFNPWKDPPSTSVGSDRCIMEEILKGDGGDVEGICFRSPAADLIPKVFTNPSDVIDAGGTLPFPDGWQVFNQGDGPATAENRPLRNGFYLSTDDVLDFDDATGKLDQLKGDKFLIGVESGGTGTTIAPEGYLEYTSVVDIPIPPWGGLPSLPDGETKYHLILYVDDLLEVSEKNEVNNFYSAVFELEIFVPNTPPEASDISFPTDEDVPINDGSLVSAASDADGDDLAFEWVSEPASGSLALDTSGAFTYDPILNFNGVDSFTFKVYDGKDYSNIATATITVNAVNDAPKVPPLTINIEEDSNAFTGNVNASDPDGDELTYAISDTPDLGTARVESNGDFTYTPTSNQNGNDSFTVSVSDGVASTESVVNVSITPINDAPTAESESVETDEDTPLGIVLTGNDVDVDDNLTYFIVAGPTKGSLNGTAPNLTYTPNPNYNGSDSLTFKVNDGSVDSETATVNITVVSVNDAPTAVSDTAETEEDTPLEIVLAGEDVDVNDTLNYFVVTGPTQGVLSGDAPDLTYTPDPNYNGGDSFTFKVNDGSLDSNISTITISVTPVNDIPTANGASVTTDEDTPVGIVLTGDDADVGDTPTYIIVTAPTKGILSGSAPTLTYAPNANYYGSDGFTFKINDGTVDSEIATVNITVNSVNDLPVANQATLSTEENIPLTGLFLTGSDADGDALTFAIFESPSLGTVLVDPGTGAFEYHPLENEVGVDWFSFMTHDGMASSIPAVVTVTIKDGIADYGFDGLLKPWKKNYTAGIGSAIPLKWYYTDPETGDPVDSIEALPEIRIKGPYKCDEGVAVDTLEYIAYPGASGFQYDTKTYLHQFNWDTNDLAAGCYDIRVFSQQTWQINGPYTIELVE